MKTEMIVVVILVGALLIGTGLFVQAQDESLTLEERVTLLESKVATLEKALTPQKPGGVTPTGKETRVSAGALFAEFDANAVAADVKYKGKTLIVTGTIVSVKPHVIEEVLVVALRGSSRFRTVDCSFSKSKASQLAQLSKGSTVIIRGVCTGKEIIGVGLADCALVKE